MIKARIIRNNGQSIIGDYDDDKKSFHFDIQTNHDFSKCLNVKGKNSDGDILISYIFSGDYTARIFVLKIDSPLVINDYISFINGLDEPVQIELKIE